MKIMYTYFPSTNLASTNIVYLKHFKQGRFFDETNENVVTSASSLWTRYLIIRMCVQKFALTWHPLPPVCKRNNLMPLIASLLALN